MIICPNCGKDNELGRIFCLKCGAKLDLNAVGPPTSARKPGIRKAKRAMKALILSTSMKVIKVGLLACTTATLTLVFLPPDLPLYKSTQEDADSFEDKKFQLEDAINSNNSLAISLSEREINGMLKKHAKQVNEDFKTEVKVGSIYASLNNDLLTFSIDRKWKNFHVFLVYTTKPKAVNGKLVFEPVSGAIGRLPIPKLVLEDYGNLLTPLWARFKFDKQTLDQVTSVKIETNYVTLSYQKT